MRCGAMAIKAHSKWRRPLTTCLDMARPRIWSRTLTTRKSRRRYCWIRDNRSFLESTIPSRFRKRWKECWKQLNAGFGNVQTWKQCPRLKNACLNCKVSLNDTVSFCGDRRNGGRKEVADLSCD